MPLPADPDPRHLHPRHPGDLHRRRVGAVCAARADAEGRRTVRAGSREGALVFNNLFLTTAAATVLTGTLYPLLLEALTRRQDFRRRAVLQPDLRAADGAAADRRAVRAAAGLETRRPARRSQRLYFVAGAALLSSSRRWPSRPDAPVLAALGIGLALGFSSARLPSSRPRTGFRAPASSVAAPFRRPAALVLRHGTRHFGLGVTRAWHRQRLGVPEKVIMRWSRATDVDIAGYAIHALKEFRHQGSELYRGCAAFTVTGRARTTRTMSPAKRLYTARRMPTTEAAIETFGSRSSIFRWATPRLTADHRSHLVEAAVTLIWLGALVMVVGGLVSLSTAGCVSAHRSAAESVPMRRRCVEVLGICHAAVRRCSSRCRRPSPSNPTRCWPIRRWRRGPANCPSSCAAWSARTSRSTIPAPILRGICACWCASGSSPATATGRFSTISSAAMANSCCWTGLFGATRSFGPCRHRRSPLARAGSSCTASRRGLDGRGGAVAEEEKNAHRRSCSGSRRLSGAPGTPSSRLPKLIWPNAPVILLSPYWLDKGQPVTGRSVFPRGKSTACHGSRFQGTRP